MTGIVAYIITKNFAKNYTNNYVNQYLTTGVEPLGGWDASTNTPTVTQGVGTPGQYYTVIKGGTWDGKDFVPGDELLFTANNQWELVPTHYIIDLVKEYAERAETAATNAESSKNVATDKANQAANSATQSSGYAVQSGNYAVQAMEARDRIVELFFTGTYNEYNEAYHDGRIKNDTISFIKEHEVIV